MDTRTLNLALGGLVAALLVCLIGIIALAMKEPPAAIPDVLAATPPVIVAGILGLLVQTKNDPKG